jgi:hypothetical protein
VNGGGLVGVNEGVGDKVAVEVGVDDGELVGVNEGVGDEIAPAVGVGLGIGVGVPVGVLADDVFVAVGVEVAAFMTSTS